MLIKNDELRSYLTQLTLFEDQPITELKIIRNNDIKVSWLIKTAKGKYLLIQHTANTKNFSQIDVINLLKAKGINYLNCYHFDLERRLAIYNWVEGQPLSTFDQPKHFNQLTDQRIYNLAELLAKIHSISNTGFSNTTNEPSYKPNMDFRQLILEPKRYQAFLTDDFKLAWKKHLPRAYQRGLINSQQQAQLAMIEEKSIKLVKKQIQLIDDLNLFSLLHGDLTPENIICHGDLIFFIDFELWHYGDRALDLAFMLEQFAQAKALTQNKEKALVNLYLEKLNENGVVDHHFSERLAFLKKYVLWKFLILVADGLTTANLDKLNQNLFQNMLDRTLQSLEESEED